MIEYDREDRCFRPLPLGRAVFASSLQLEEALSIRVSGPGGPPCFAHIVCLFCLLWAACVPQLHACLHTPGRLPPAWLWAA